MSTPTFQPVPALMFVGDDGDLAQACATLMPHLQLLSVRHVAGAMERILVCRPLVVVVDETIVDGVPGLIECAHDVGAEVVRASATVRESLSSQLRMAAALAESKRRTVASSRD